MKIRNFFMLTYALCFGALHVTAQEQNSFSTEGPITNPAALPTAVWNVLARDKSVRELMSDEDGPTPKPEWFTSSLMHTSASRLLYVVVGSGPMLGAHSTHYWLVSSEGANAHIALRAFGDSLSFQRRMHHGWQDVLVSYSRAKGMANIQYAFNGSRYVKTRTWTDQVD